MISPGGLQMSFCIKCGTKMGESDSFCIKCGWPAADASCPLQPDIVGDAALNQYGNGINMPICKSCGTQLMDGDVFCYKCGVTYNNEKDASTHNISLIWKCRCGFINSLDSDCCQKCYRPNTAEWQSGKLNYRAQEAEILSSPELQKPPASEANETSFQHASIITSVASVESEPTPPDLLQSTPTPDMPPLAPLSDLPQPGPSSPDLPQPVQPADNWADTDIPAPTPPMNNSDSTTNTPFNAGTAPSDELLQKKSPQKLHPAIIASLAAAAVIIVVLLIGIFSGWFVRDRDTTNPSIDSVADPEVPVSIAPAATQSGGGASTQPIPSPETPPPTVSTPVSPSEPDLSPKPEPAAAPETSVDWKQLYFEEMQAAIAYRDNINRDNLSNALDNHEGRYPLDLNGFMLADLNFDGVPELIIYGDGNYEAGIPGMKFFTITRNGVVKFFEGTADPPGNRYYDELGSPEFNWQLYKKKTDGSFVYMFCGEIGAEMQASSASIYSSDKSTLLDSSFAETAKMADLLERYDDQQGIQSWYFNGNEFTKDEYIRQRGNLLAGYEAMQYTFSTLIKWDYMADFTNSELWALLDSYVPEEDYVQVVGAGAEINVQGNLGAASDNEGYANPPSSNDNAAPEPRNQSLSNVIFSTNNWIRLCICWENGKTTVFERDRDSSIWTMESMDGNYRIVDPGFSDEVTAFTISFPTTSAKYKLFSDNTGSFNGESMTWYFETDPNFSKKSANGTNMTQDLGDALGHYMLISIKVLWSDGNSAILYKQSDGSWMMKDRGGSFSSASPKFSRSPGFVTMSFPSSSAQYTFYDNGVGTYNGEGFSWYYDYSDR